MSDAKANASLRREALKRRTTSTEWMVQMLAAMTPEDRCFAVAMQLASLDDANQLQAINVLRIQAALRGSPEYLSAKAAIKTGSSWGVEDYRAAKRGARSAKT